MFQEILYFLTNSTQGFTVTPVVSFPQDKVIVFVSRGSDILTLTGFKAFTPILLFLAQTMISKF